MEGIETRRRSEETMAGVVLTLAVVCALAIAYQDTLKAMAEVWFRSDTFLHGVLVAPISLYLIWKRRVLLKTIPRRSSWTAVVLLVIATLLWFMARLANVVVVQQFMVITMVLLVVWAINGRRYMWAIIFPLAYLYFAVPFGEFLLPGLMDFTANFVVKALQGVGIPVYQEGMYISVPNGNFEVKEACSGLRYLIASLALGTLYAYVYYRTWKKKAVFVALSIILPLIANAIRAFLIVLLAYLSNMRLAVGVDHVIYGWIFFGVVMFVLFLIGARYQEVTDRTNEEGIARTGLATSTPQKVLYPAITSVIVMFVVIAGPVAAKNVDQKQRNDMTFGDEPVLPRDLQLWDGPEQTSEGWQPSYLGADLELKGRYRKSGTVVDLYIAYYRTQRQGAELVNSQNKIYGNGDWIEFKHGKWTVELSNGEDLRANTAELYNGNKRLLVWYWYDLGGYAISSGVMAKIAESWQRLRGRPDSGALIALAVIYDNHDVAERVLAEFVVDNQTRLTAVVGEPE